MSLLEILQEQAWADETRACVAYGNEASALITSKRMDLSKNWNPTGFYTPQQIEAVVGNVTAIANSALEQAKLAHTKVSNMPASEYPNLLSSERKGLEQWVGEGAKFITIARNAQKAGITAVDAPSLKPWVLSVLARVDSTITAVATVLCMQPWWAGLYGAFKATLEIGVKAIKGILGVALKLGELVASVPSAVGNVLGTVGTLLKIAKWVAILGGGTLLVFYARRELIARNLLPSGNVGPSSEP